MNQPFTIPQSHRVRVIVDTDAACEADDPFAIAQALLTQKFDVRGIIAEHFGTPGSMEESFEVIQTLTSLTNSKVPIYKGNEGPLEQSYTSEETHELSAASRFIIDEASRQRNEPLFVLCLGASTNIAAALHNKPEIAQKMTIIWIGTQAATGEKPIREFNAANDVTAANILLESKAEVWLVPLQVYRTMNVSISELAVKVLPCGKLGEYLFTQLNDYNHSDGAWWTSGESWSLGDSPAIGLALDQNCGVYDYHPAPLILPDSTSQYDPARPQVRIYSSINSRFILEDLYAKLALFANSKQ
jgi:hypothetical protein